MTHIQVELRTGETREIEANPADSVMVAIRDAGIDEIAALCGGNCSCATCHVYLAPEAFAALGQVPDDEDDMLESTANRQVTSRLGCQVMVGNLPANTTVTIAPEE